MGNRWLHSDRQVVVIINHLGARFDSSRLIFPACRFEIWMAAPMAKSREHAGRRWNAALSLKLFLSPTLDVSPGCRCAAMLRGGSILGMTMCLKTSRPCRL